MSGISLIPALQGNTLDKRDLYFEHYGKAAIRSGKWKLVHSGNDDNWELYDLEVDRTELNDLSKTYPDKVSRLTEKWETWAKNVGVKDTRK